jgi:hypothetical protein
MSVYGNYGGVEPNGQHPYTEQPEVVMKTMGQRMWEESEVGKIHMAMDRGLIGVIRSLFMPVASVLGMLAVIIGQIIDPRSDLRTTLAMLFWLVVLPAGIFIWAVWAARREAAQFKISEEVNPVVRRPKGRTKNKSRAS